MAKLNEGRSLSASLLNTSYSAAPAAVSCREYFRVHPKLGAYSIVSLQLSVRETVEIVIDQHASWINDLISKYFDDPPEKLSLRAIEGFLVFANKEFQRSLTLAGLMGLTPHKNINRSKFIRVFYLKDICNIESQRNLVLSLLAQTMIERYTKRDSRLAVLEVEQNGLYKNEYVLLVQSKKNKDEVFIFDTKQHPELHQQVMPSMLKTFSQHASIQKIKVLNGQYSVQHPQYRYDEKSRRFSIFSGKGSELHFQVEGRTPAEKRFRAEQRHFESASDTALIPLEIGFHPFWRRLGHTTIRVGENLFELTHKGWREHSGGERSPRAFLFNNPFFKFQFKRYKTRGMPPASVTVVLQISRKQAEAIVKTARQFAKSKNGENDFSLFRNNCNHGCMRVLELVGLPGFTSKGYIGFSSVLSFRKLLLDPSLPVLNRYIYVLPGNEINESNLRRWVPVTLYRYNCWYMEFFRSMPGLLFDALAFCCRRISDIAYKLFRIRLWQGTDIYFQHH